MSTSIPLIAIVLLFISCGSGQNTELTSSRAINIEKQHQSTTEIHQSADDSQFSNCKLSSSSELGTLTSLNLSNEEAVEVLLLAELSKDAQSAEEVTYYRQEISKIIKDHVSDYKARCEGFGFFSIFTGLIASIFPPLNPVHEIASMFDPLNWLFGGILGGGGGHEPEQQMCTLDLNEYGHPSRCSCEKGFKYDPKSGQCVK